MRMNGLIVKGIGGFYYVEAADQIYECRARGIFRKDGKVPLVGDRVVISTSGGGTGLVEEILPRRNYLLRPPIANIDQLVIVVSVCEPAPSMLNVDKTIAAAEDRGIEPILVFSKVDLQDAAQLCEVYSGAGFRVFCVSSVTGEGVPEVEKLLAGKTTALTGNSGVGKSSLINSMFDTFHLKTGEISRKLGRGRHTTRQVELFQLEDGGYLADTPGFSSISLEKCDPIPKENLQFCFREFAPYLGGCKFSTCSHTCEKGCAVIRAVEEGRISRSRHESYVAMYWEMKDLKEWNQK